MTPIIAIVVLALAVDPFCDVVTDFVPDVVGDVAPAAGVTLPAAEIPPVKGTGNPTATSKQIDDSTDSTCSNGNCRVVGTGLALNRDVEEGAYRPRPRPAFPVLRRMFRRR